MNNQERCTQRAGSQPLSLSILCVGWKRDQFASATRGEMMRVVVGAVHCSIYIYTRILPWESCDAQCFFIQIDFAREKQREREKERKVYA